MSFFSRLIKGSRVSEDLDQEYPVRKDVDVTQVSKFRPRVKKRLSTERWEACQDEFGRVWAVDAALKHIQRGGVEPSIRGEVWPFLLGLYSPNSTHEERNAMREARRDFYARLKQECNEVDPVVGSGVVVDFPRVLEDGSDVPLPSYYSGPHIDDPSSTHVDVNGGGAAGRDGGEGQSAVLTERERLVGRVGEERVRKWRLGLHQIGVDVQRADRTLVFYEEEGNRSRLMEVLAVYSWFDPDVGYCQGMSDLMSPFIVIFPNNADAFWCFERLLRPIRSDFMGTSASIGVQKEIDNLKNITRVLDPELYAHLDEIGAGSMFFTVRPIMAMFRRELSFADSIYFWEMMWSWDYDARDADLLAMADQSVLNHHAVNFPHSAASPHALHQNSFAAATTAAAEAAAAAVAACESSGSGSSGVEAIPSGAAKAAAKAAAAEAVAAAVSSSGRSGVDGVTPGAARMAGAAAAVVRVAGREEEGQQGGKGRASPLRPGTRSTAAAWASVEAAVTSGALTDTKRNSSSDPAGPGGGSAANSRASTPSLPANRLPSRKHHSERKVPAAATTPPTTNNSTGSRAIDGARSRSWAGVGPYRKDVIRYVTLDASAGKLAASKSAKYLSSRRSAVALWHKAQKLAGPVGTAAATAAMPGDAVVFAVSAFAGRPITPTYAAAAGAGAGAGAGAAAAAGGAGTASVPPQLNLPPKAHRRTGSFGLGRRGSKKHPHTAAPASPTPQQAPSAATTESALEAAETAVEKAAEAGAVTGASAADAAAAAAEEAGAIVPPQPSAFYALPESAGVAVPYVRREEQERMTTFCVLAIVLKLRDEFIDDASGLDDVVDSFNAAAGSWDVKKLCKRAVDLHRQYLVLKLAAHELGRTL